MSIIVKCLKSGGAKSAFTVMNVPRFKFSSHVKVRVIISKVVSQNKVVPSVLRRVSLQDICVFSFLDTGVLRKVQKPFYFLLRLRIPLIHKSPFLNQLLISVHLVINIPVVGHQVVKTKPDFVLSQIRK